jgi:hypothetical protein
MARTRIKGKLVPAVMLLLAIGITSLVIRSFSDYSVPGRLRLPVGRGTPAINLGERHGLILASDGSLWTWGADFAGWPVLGLGKRTTRPTSLRRIGHDTNWVSISAGANHSLALKADGTLWTWGESVQGRYRSPMALYAPVPAAPGNDWKQAAAGGIHNLALKKDGTLWGWGDNWAGSVGMPLTNGSAVPVQIGSATNWFKIWAGLLESVGMQSDGSLWYWGENPNPEFAQGENPIFAPLRISSNTNWSDVAFGSYTVLALKSDGTLWTWGREAHVYTGARDTAQDATPTRIGTDSDWRSLSSAADWWCQGLTKKDGSLWFMDASEGKPNGPRPPYQPVRFRRIEFGQDYVAYVGGAVHGAAGGVHGPIGVLLTAQGEVWTWGMVLGDPPTLSSRCQELAASVAGMLHVKVPPVAPGPVFRHKAWPLRNIEPDTAAKP